MSPETIRFQRRKMIHYSVEVHASESQQALEVHVLEYKIRNLFELHPAQNWMENLLHAHASIPICSGRNKNETKR
jgi:hypothetical protein